MRCFILSILVFSLLFVFSACQSFQDGPLAVENEQDILNKTNKPAAAGKQIKVSKAYYDGSQVSRIYWDDSDFNLPDFEQQTFTITQVEINLVTDNKLTNLCATMFGQTCNATVSDCQLPTSLCWQGEYPEEHPFYNGFSIQIEASDVLDDVEAMCSITYILN